MIITIEKNTGPFVVTCGYDKKEFVFLEDTLQHIATIAHTDTEVTVEVSVTFHPTPLTNAFGPIETL